ncbi:hypothetical protein M407DRAFT_245039 [Tulasnella calospora MUT 4182]|uniref:Uncharacterized protein n=1 Tax=Tulasnella calospora MUT 4182 TaxID=1051891 RepID=A0A0C3LN53_9AGAM|nr:hypothetical protein M407DRAFT_245039 [Tulasnella calospora MUT 4182]
MRGFGCVFRPGRPFQYRGILHPNKKRQPLWLQFTSVPDPPNERGRGTSDCPGASISALKSLWD